MCRSGFAGAYAHTGLLKDLIAPLDVYPCHLALEPSREANIVVCTSVLSQQASSGRIDQGGSLPI